MQELLNILNTDFLGIHLWMFIVGIIVLILLIIIIVKLCNRGVVVVEDVKIKHGHRYTKNENVEDKNGQTVISHLEGDLVLMRGQVYTAKKDSKFLPGKYSILSTEENTKKFNIRLGGFVREYAHNADIIIGDGEEICSVSHTTILR